MASGAVQSLVTMTAHQIGNRLPDWAVLPVMLVLGAAWGVCQVGVVAGCVALIPSGSSPRLSFPELGTALGLAAAPFVVALIAWLGGLILVGRTLYLDPELAIVLTGVSAGALATVVVATGVACVWSGVLVVVRSGGTRAGVMAGVLLALTAIGYYRLAPFVFQSRLDQGRILSVECDARQSGRGRCCLPGDRFCWSFTLSETSWPRHALSLSR